MQETILHYATGQTPKNLLLFLVYMVILGGVRGKNQPKDLTVSTKVVKLKFSFSF